jgi:uncharacterized membrane protein YeaQ/YmgE (transglycosylase-associated protein family)
MKSQRTGGTMSLIWTLIIGLIAGALAKFVMPGKDPGGILITMALGVAGSFLATFIGQGIGWYSAGTSTGLIDRRWSHPAAGHLSDVQGQDRMTQTQVHQCHSPHIKPSTVRSNRKPSQEIVCHDPAPAAHKDVVR